MLRRIRSVAGAALVAVAALLVLSAPAGAQQLVDAGKEGDGSGGLAFVIMVFVVVCIAGRGGYDESISVSSETAAVVTCSLAGALSPTAGSGVCSSTLKRNGTGSDLWPSSVTVTFMPQSPALSKDTAATYAPSLPAGVTLLF